MLVFNEVVALYAQCHYCEAPTSNWLILVLKLRGNSKSIFVINVFVGPRFTTFVLGEHPSPSLSLEDKSSG